MIRIGLLAIAMLAACEKKGAIHRDEGAWWCWPETVCFATRDACQRASRATGVNNTCVARRKAFCSHGCRLDATDKPSCGADCAVSLETCEMIGRKTVPCREQPPPSHPELYPEYLEPGWWCWSQRGPDGRMFSWCDKAKEMCEWYLDDTLAKLGTTRAQFDGDAAAAAGCTRATTSPYCWSRRVDGELAFVCALEREQCEATRANAPDVSSAGAAVTDLSGCSQWSYN